MGIINNMLSNLRAATRVCMRQAMPMASQRMYRTELGLDADTLMEVNESNADKSVELWKAQVESNKNALVLKTNDEIEQYVWKGKSMEDVCPRDINGHPAFRDGWGCSTRKQSRCPWAHIPVSCLTYPYLIVSIPLMTFTNGHHKPRR